MSNHRLQLMLRNSLIINYYLKDIFFNNLKIQAYDYLSPISIDCFGDREFYKIKFNK